MSDNSNSTNIDITPMESNTNTNMDVSEDTPPPPYPGNPAEQSLHELPPLPTQEPKQEATTAPAKKEPKQEATTAPTQQGLTPPPPPPMYMQQQGYMPPPPIPVQQQAPLTPAKSGVGKTGSIRKLFKKRYGSRYGASAAKKAFVEPNKDKEIDEEACYVALVIDRSGSMSSMGSEVSGSINAFLEDQKNGDTELGTKTQVQFAIFDNSYDELYTGTPIQQIPEITDADVKPRGGTALNDAICQALDNAIATVNAAPKMPGQVIVFILTDGQENASQVYTSEDVKKRISALEKEPFEWEFTFAAANQDAFASGSRIGMSQKATSNTMQWGGTKDSLRQVFFDSSDYCMERRRCKQAVFKAQK